MISVLILTRNEEQDLPGCLASVAWSDDVHVFDSFSNDRTGDVAGAHGAKFTQRMFDSYSKQRNAALSTLPFKHEWLFILDADERPTVGLVTEMLDAVSDAGRDIGGFKIRRKDYFQGRWLKHAQITPWYIRLVRHKNARYIRDINEIIQVDGQIGTLADAIDHYPFSKGLGHWIDKHNLYSTMEADRIAMPREASVKAALFGDDFHVRRTAQKAISIKMPARPILKWLYMMFWKGAVLDGMPGVRYATLQCIYEYFIVLKQKEILKTNEKTEK